MFKRSINKMDFYEINKLISERASVKGSILLVLDNNGGLSMSMQGLTLLEQILMLGDAISESRKGANEKLEAEHNCTKEHTKEK